MARHFRYELRGRKFLHFSSKFVHLTRCLHVLRDAAASQLNKHLSTNSDMYVRAHTRTADNCGVGDVAAACSTFLVVLMARTAKAFYEVDRAIQVCEMNNGAIILSIKMATYIGLPLS